jgi:hypothetical protein
MGKVAYINRCILMDNLHIPSSGSTTPLQQNQCIHPGNQWDDFVEIDLSDLVVQNVNLHKELSPYGSGVLGVPMAPLLALPLFQLE